MTNPTAGNIHANYPGWIFRLNVPTNFVDRIGSNNDSSSRSEDENGDNLEGVQLLDDKNPTDNYGLSTFSSSGLRYLAELCPHGVSVTALPIEESKCNTKSKNANANRTKSKIEQNEQAETNWSWSFSSQSSPSQWNVTSSNLLSVTYRPAHEAYPSYTNISKKKEAWHRSVGACFEKGGWACRHALRGKMCGSSDSNVAGKVQPQKKRSHRWSKMKRIITGSPKPIHRMKVNYSVDDILFMEPMIAAPTPPDSESSSLLENEADSATKRGLWIRGVGYCHALRIYLRPKFGAYSPNANNDGDNELLDSTNSRDHNAGFELPPMDSWDNLPSPPWETLNGEAKGQQKNTHKGPILTFAIPFQQTSTSSSGNDEQKPMSIDKCPPLLWKVDHPPNPHVAIDSLSLLEGKLHLHQHKAKQAKSSSSSTSYHYDAPTNVYINGYQSWSYSGSVAQGEVQPTSAMPKVLSEAFNRGGVVLSSSSRYSVESTEDADDCWNENVGLDSEAMDSKSSIGPNDEEELNEETAFYKSDFFACISSNGATATQLNGERILLDEEGGPALIVGFLSQRHQFGAVLMDKGLRRFNLVACHEGVVAAPSSKSTSALNGRQSLTTDWAYCQIVDSSCYDEESMVYYVHASGDHNDARPMEKGLTAGWCSWYHYYSDIDHDSLSKNAHILERHQSNIGFNVCLIDDGYMTSWGDWTSLKPGKFLKDGGMRVLADTIRSKGMKPGVWLAPFACDKSSKLAKDHPDWIIRNDKGRIANSANCGKYFYGLDATHPGVRRHV